MDDNLKKIIGFFIFIIVMILLIIYVAFGINRCTVLSESYIKKTGDYLKANGGIKEFIKPYLEGTNE